MAEAQGTDAHSSLAESELNERITGIPFTPLQGSSRRPSRAPRSAPPSLVCRRQTHTGDSCKTSTSIREDDESSARLFSREDWLEGSRIASSPGRSTGQSSAWIFSARSSEQCSRIRSCSAPHEDLAGVGDEKSRCGRLVRWTPSMHIDNISGCSGTSRKNDPVQKTAGTLDHAEQVRNKYQERRLASFGEDLFASASVNDLLESRKDVQTAHSSEDTQGVMANVSPDPHQQDLHSSTSSLSSWNGPVHPPRGIARAKKQSRVSARFPREECTSNFQSGSVPNRGLGRILALPIRMAHFAVCAWPPESLSSPATLLRMEDGSLSGSAQSVPDMLRVSAGEVLAMNEYNTGRPGMWQVTSSSTGATGYVPATIVAGQELRQWPESTEFFKLVTNDLQESQLREQLDDENVRPGTYAVHADYKEASFYGSSILLVKQKGDEAHDDDWIEEFCIRHTNCQRFELEKDPTDMRRKQFPTLAALVYFICSLPTYVATDNELPVLKNVLRTSCSPHCSDSI